MRTNVLPVFLSMPVVCHSVETALFAPKQLGHGWDNALFSEVQGCHSACLMTQRAFTDPLQAKSIWNNYNHVAQLLPLLFCGVLRRAGQLAWRKSNFLWRILDGNDECYGGNQLLLAVSKRPSAMWGPALIQCINGPSILSNGSQSRPEPAGSLQRRGRSASVRAGRTSASWS